MPGLNAEGAAEQNHQSTGHENVVDRAFDENDGDRDSHPPPGEGSIDWECVIRELDECDFNGTLILELAGGGGEAELLDRARRGRRFLEGFPR